MTPAREERYEVEFPVFLSWQAGQTVRRVAARCLDLSVSGARLETKDRIQPGTTVLVHSEHFGRMGLASVKYCSVNKLNYDVGVHFGTALHLSDPARRTILDGLIRKPAPEPTEAEIADTLSEIAVFTKEFI